MKHRPLLFASVVALATAPAMAGARFDSGYVDFFSSAATFTFDAALGTTSFSNGYNDYGGCEDTPGCIGAYQSSQFSLTITDTSAVYDLSLSQGQDIHASPYLDTFVNILFKADREQRLSIDILESESSVGCRACSHLFDNSIGQFYRDGFWWVAFNPRSFATVVGGQQTYAHKVSLTMTDVPEPATWAMLVAGFGLVGAAARRRRDATRLCA